ncbi:hypothetical protein TWF730_009384 [Orbilia blumenaviensis]|uniref:F-box domain-containing protein n=1 Tax=Orbilia blumenaviensis TaxID=1796055 RepID=A0AAV9UZ18_9PEZI
MQSENESITTLQGLPYDIIYGICEHLQSNDDIQSLRLVSTALASKIPPTRLEEIQSQRTIFKHPYELIRLERLASLPLEKRNRIKHVIIDLSNPHVVPIPSGEFDSQIMKYPGPTRLKLLKFYYDYRNKNPFHFGNKYTRPFRKIADKVLRNSGSGKTITPVWVEAVAETEPDIDDFSFTRRSEIYSILSTNFSPETANSKFWKGKGRSEEPFDFFQSVIGTFRLLPNLSIITFKDKSRQQENKAYTSTVWKAFNPTLAELLKKNPIVEELPWHDWFQNSHEHNYGLTLAHGYPGILFCAALAGCRISEIRMDGLGWHGGVDCVPLWSFGRWYKGIDGLTFRPCVPNEGHYSSDVKAFTDTYANLSRLDICIALDWMVEYTSEQDVSQLFMKVIRNVKDLYLTRVLDVNSDLCKPSFPFPQMAVLPNLQNLELHRAGITIKALTEFLVANKATLRKVVGILTIRHTMTRQYMINFLTQLKGDLDLRVFAMDFLTNKEPEKECYLSVDIRGSWKDDHARHGKYRVGVKCERGRYWNWYLDREELPRSNWITKTSWEEFIEGIEEVRPNWGCKCCLEHWNCRITNPDEF